MPDIKYNYADDEDEIEEEKPKSNFVEKLKGAGRTAGKYAKQGYETAKKVGGHIQRGARAVSEGSVKVARGITKTAYAYKKFAKPRYEAAQKSAVVNPMNFGISRDLSVLTTPNIGLMQPKQKAPKRSRSGFNPFSVNAFGQIEVRRKR